MPARPEEISDSSLYHLQSLCRVTWHRVTYLLNNVHYSFICIACPQRFIADGRTAVVNHRQSAPYHGFELVQTILCQYVIRTQPHFATLHIHNDDWELVYYCPR